MGLKIIKFYAEWCGPCKQLKPVFDDVCPLYTDVEFMDIDVDDTEYEYLKKEYNVRSVPRIFFIKNNEPVFEHTGFISRDQLVEKIEELK